MSTQMKKQKSIDVPMVQEVKQRHGRKTYKAEKNKLEEI